MDGRRVVVSLYPMPPYVSLDLRSGQFVVRGFLGEIWRILEDKLNFKSEYVIEELEVGMSGLRRGERDVVLRPIVVTPEDVDTFQYTVPLIRSWYELYVKDSDEVNSSYSYIRNWSNELWICTLAVVILFSFKLYTMLQLSTRLLHTTVVDMPPTPQRSGTCNTSDVLALSKRHATILHQKRIFNEQSLGNCFMSTVTSFCSQGGSIQSQLTSIRILILSFLVFAMIMVNSYSALLISQLTLRERYLPFNNLDELSESSSGYVMCVREESYPHTHFRVNGSSRELKEKWSRFVNRKPCVSDGEFPAEVMCASHVTILESPAVMRESVIKNTLCHMTHLKGKYWPVDISVLIFRHFEDHAKGQLNKKIMRLRETGILHHLLKKWVPSDEIMSPAEDPMVNVSFDHIEGVLYLYAAAMAFSLVIFTLEKTADAYKHYFAGNGLNELQIHSYLKNIP